MTGKDPQAGGLLPVRCSRTGETSSVVDMSWINEVGDLLQQYKGASPSAPPASTESDFATVAKQAPPGVLADGLAAAFRSQSTPPFAQMVAQLFGQSDGEQRAGILNQLMAGAGTEGLASGLLAHIPGFSGSGAITSAQAQQVSPDTARQLAAQAASRDPSIMERAGEFYAQHPRLVQGLGAAALALVMSHVSQRH